MDYGKLKANFNGGRGTWSAVAENNYAQHL